MARFTTDDVWPAVHHMRWWVKGHVVQQCDQDDVLAEACLVLLVRVLNEPESITGNLEAYASGVVRYVAYNLLNNTGWLNKHSKDFDDNFLHTPTKSLGPLSQLLVKERDASHLRIIGEADLTIAERALINNQMEGATTLSLIEIHGLSHVKNNRHRAIEKLRHKVKVARVTEDILVSARNAQHP